MNKHFENLINLKHDMEEMESICNFDRKINPDGETWQDRAYLIAHRARKLSELILANALDRMTNVNVPQTSPQAQASPQADSETEAALSNVCTGQIFQNTKQPPKV